MYCAYFIVLWYKLAMPKVVKQIYYLLTALGIVKKYYNITIGMNYRLLEGWYTNEEENQRKNCRANDTFITFLC